MAIHSSGQFEHHVPIHRGLDGIWRGRAAPNQQADGLVGDAPALELSGGTIVLARTQRRIWHASWGRQVHARVAFSAGDAFETVAEDGDVLSVWRGPTGDIGAALTRNRNLVMSLGAGASAYDGGSLIVEIDPRVAEHSYPYLAAIADRADALLLWLDPDSADLDAQLEILNHIPPRIQMVQFVVRCDDWARSTALNRRVMESRHSVSKGFEHVSERFATKEEWLAYSRQLPKGRPPDLFLRFVFGEQRCELREGEYQWREPWHLYVEKVDTPGIPGECSQFGIARPHRDLTVETFTTSVKQMATGAIDFGS